MTFSEHDELAIELEAQNTHKLELKLFPARTGRRWTGTAARG